MNSIHTATPDKVKKWKALAKLVDSISNFENALKVQVDDSYQDTSIIHIGDHQAILECGTVKEYHGRIKHLAHQM